MLGHHIWWEVQKDKRTNVITKSLSLECYSHKLKAYGRLHIWWMVVCWSVPGRHNSDLMNNHGGRQKLQVQRGALGAFVEAKSDGSPVGNNGREASHEQAPGPGRARYVSRVCARLPRLRALALRRSPCFFPRKLTRKWELKKTKASETKQSVFTNKPGS